MSLVSLWQDRHPRTPLPPPALEGDYDVIVIGAGLTGLTTALLLGRAGKSVLVIEADHAGVGTTGRSTAKVSLLQGTQYSRISRRHTDDVLRDYATANREGQAWLARFCADHGVAMQTRPAYTYATTPQGERSLRAELEATRAAGLETEWVDDVPLPFPTRGAVRLAGQQQVDPVEVVDELTLQATAHGVRLIEGVRVRRVTGRRPVRVLADQGAATAGTVVVATNMPILDRGAFFARMSPSRSYALAYRTPEPAVDGQYLSADSPARSLRDAPAADGTGDLLLVGGNGHKVGSARTGTRQLDGLRKWTARWFPEAEETHAWSAQDYVPHHALPYAGPVLPGHDEILVAGGYSKWGMTNAVGASLALSSRILGGHVGWARILEPWTSLELRGTLDSLKLNGEVGLELAGGWLRPALRPGSGPSPRPDDGAVRLDRAGTPTAVSTVDGVERRVSAVCTHLRGIVRWNDAERSWDCPLHASRFRPDGEVLEGPATCGLARR